MGSDIVPRIAAGMIPSGAGQMAIEIGRREFIAALGGATVTWPLVARAEQERIRRIGVLMGSRRMTRRSSCASWHFAVDFKTTTGRRVAISTLTIVGPAATPNCSGITRPNWSNLKPDVLFAGQTSTLLALKQATSTLPIVFVQVDDPVGGGSVAGLARPGGNITGFGTFEYGCCGEMGRVGEGA